MVLLWSLWGEEAAVTVVSILLLSRLVVAITIEMWSKRAVTRGSGVSSSSGTRVYGFKEQVQDHDNDLRLKNQQRTSAIRTEITVLNTRLEHTGLGARNIHTRREIEQDIQDLETEMARMRKTREMFDKMVPVLLDDHSEVNTAKKPALTKSSKEVCAYMTNQIIMPDDDEEEEKNDQAPPSKKTGRNKKRKKMTTGDDDDDVGVTKKKRRKAATTSKKPGKSRKRKKMDTDDDESETSKQKQKNKKKKRRCVLPAARPSMSSEGAREFYCPPSQVTVSSIGREVQIGHQPSKKQTYNLLVVQREMINIEERKREIKNNFKHMFAVESMLPQFVEHDRCDDCFTPLVNDQKAAMLVCPNLMCSKSTKHLDATSSNLPYGVEVDLNKHVYHRKKHFEQWLSQFSENVDPIPDHVIVDIMIVFSLLHVKSSHEVKPTPVKEILKNLGYANFVDKAHRITYRINGYPIARLTKAETDVFISMFEKTQTPFFSFVEGRSNFLNASYVVNKLCTITGKPWFKECFPLLKSKPVLRVQDKMWKRIVANVKPEPWHFERST
jgi:hypothetical protein